MSKNPEPLPKIKLYREWYVVSQYGGVTIHQCEETALDEVRRTDTVGSRWVSEQLTELKAEGKQPLA